MGLLTAITIFIALIVDFFFLPPLLIALDKDKSAITDQEQNTIQTQLAANNPAS